MTPDSLSAETARGTHVSPAREFQHDRLLDPEFPEVDCLRGRLPHATIAAAEQRARRIGTGAERVLIAAGAIGEDDYVRTLAEWLGIPFTPLTEVERHACPLSDDALVGASVPGILRLEFGNRRMHVVAPHNARQFVRAMADHPHLASGMWLTSQGRLHQFVMRHAAHAVGRCASFRLAWKWPLLSASPQSARLSLVVASICAALALTAALAVPETSALALQLTLAVIFLGWLVLRLVGTLMKRPRPPRRPRIPDDPLPVYTIIAALYREASSVERLTNAIRQLDYPPEKLDVKLVIEPDDLDTRHAIERLQLPPSFEMIVAPDEGPRTKPKALNVALPFARGHYLVVYDAEDRPEAGQLRHAIAAFAAGERNLACVQAQLTIDNTADGWLAGYFTAEYAGQFDVFLPSLAALHLPLPLGGSSNHFLMAALREVGGWDSFNVTEDADLGMRLARFGYLSDVIESTTHEEAPTRFRPWLCQRTRWFKGWMQTWLVHMRTPRRLLMELGLPSFVVFQLIVGGNVLAALVHPVFIGLFAYAAMNGTLLSGDGIGVTLLAGLFGTTVVIGYMTSALLGCIGLARRGLLSTAWVLLLTPLHWLMLSLAAWRALVQLIREPYRWEKTDHGFARSSRLAEQATRSLAALEKHLSMVLKPHVR